MKAGLFAFHFFIFCLYILFLIYFPKFIKQALASETNHGYFSDVHIYNNNNNKRTASELRFYTCFILEVMNLGYVGTAFAFGMALCSGSAGTVLRLTLISSLVPLFCRAITLDNQLVVLSTSAPDAGRYYVQAVNERSGENKTSPSIYLSIASK